MQILETKESVCIRKEFNSQGIGLGHQYGRRDVMWKHSIKTLFLFYMLLPLMEDRVEKQSVQSLLRKKKKETKEKKTTLTTTTTKLKKP